MKDIPILGEKKERTAPLLINIAIPTHDVVPAKFAISLANMAAYAGTGLIAQDVADVYISYYMGTYIAKARQDLVLGALKRDVTHILFLDSDMTFPRDLLTRLLRHNLPIVGINYAKRRIPTEFVAIKHVSRESDALGIEDGVNLREGSEHCPTYEDSTGLEEVDAAGFGAMLIRSEVFWSMEPPHFSSGWDEKNKRWVGEDVYFCLKARQEGFRTFVDHDLSKECGHMGTLKFLTAHADDQWEREGRGKYGSGTDNGLQQPSEHDS